MGDATVKKKHLLLKIFNEYFLIIITFWEFVKSYVLVCPVIYVLVCPVIYLVVVCPILISPLSRAICVSYAKNRTNILLSALLWHSK